MAAEVGWFGLVTLCISTFVGYLITEDKRGIIPFVSL